MLSSTLPSVRVGRAIDFVRHHLGQLHRRMVPPSAAMMEMITNAWAAQAITAAADLGIADVLAPSRVYAHIGLTSSGHADTYRALYGRR